MNDNLKIAFNSGVIFVRLVLSTLIGVITSRVVLEALGASDYGLYNVVGGIVTLLNIVNSAMLSTTYRYIAFEVGKKEAGDLNKVFNASFIIHGGFALAILLLGLVVGDWYINNYLNVEAGKLPDALFVFHVSLIATSASTLLVPYQGVIVAFEKFTVNAIIDISFSILRFVLILLLIYGDGNRLRIYSVIMMATTILSCATYLIYSYRHHRSIVSIRLQFDGNLFKDMMSYAWWTLFGAVAIIGKDQGGKVLINYFFGTLVNAAYAVASQVESMVLTFARSLSHAAVPQITKNFSGGNETRSITLTSYISKYTFFMMAMVAFPIILNMDYLLNLWLVDVPEGATLFCELVILNALISCFGEGIPALVNATGNIKTYQLVYQSFNFLGLPIAFIAFKLGYNQYAITIVYCIINFLCIFVRVFLLKRIFDFDVKKFVSISYLKIFYISVPLIVFFYFYDDSGFSHIQHLIWMVIAETFLLVTIYFLGLDKKEHQLINQYFIKIVQRNRK